MVFNKKKVGVYDYEYFQSSEINKDTLVFIHGFGADSRFQWSEQLKEFSKEYHLIVPNLIHFGGSTSNEASYSVDFQTRGIKLLLDSLNIKSAHVVGISYGGTIAADFAYKFPDATKKVVLVDAPVGFHSDSLFQAQMKRLNIESAADLLLPTEYEAAKKLMEEAYYGKQFFPKYVAKDIIDPMFVKNRDKKMKLLEKIAHPTDSILSYPIELNKEILIVWGREDQIVPLEVGQQLDAFYKNSKLVIFEKSKHFTPAEYPKEFNEKVLEFLK